MFETLVLLEFFKVFLVFLLVFIRIFGISMGLFFLVFFLEFVDLPCVFLFFLVFPLVLSLS